MGFLDRFLRKMQESNPDTPLNVRRALELIGKGNLLEDGGEPTKALALYDTATELAPFLARSHLNRGNALAACEDFNGAIEAFSKALEIDPNYAGAHFNLGNTYLRFGKLELACEAFTQALRVRPDYVDAEVALGAALDDLRQFESACAHYRRALKLQPDYVQVHCNLANSLKKLNRFEEALKSYQHTIALDPQYADAYNNMATVLQDLGRLDEAKSGYLKALELKPDSIDTLGNLLFVLNYVEPDPCCSPLAHARKFGDLVARKVEPYEHWNVSLHTDRCLRVGFVSGDLREHPVGFFLENVLKALVQRSAGRLLCVAYSNHSFEDAITQRLRSNFQLWRSCVGLSDAALAKQIHDDAIDVLIDLSGHTASNRLPAFAFRPAPVQVSWLGYFGTTGVQAMDYLLADPWTLPLSDECNFTEKIWRLPETRLCFTPPALSIDVSKLPALDNGYVTFGCFNNLTKMIEPVVALWSTILRAVPESRLFLKSPQLNEPSVRQRVQEQFSIHGIDFSRLLFEGLSPRHEYLAAYHRVDIALDPFPYTGGTTTVEALWMGVPVVTLAGDRYLSRQGVGLLANAGLNNWIANTTLDYVEIARSRSSDLQSLCSLRAQLREQVLGSPIFDAPRFAQHFENALRDMWRNWCKQRGSQTT